MLKLTINKTIKDLCQRMSKKLHWLEKKIRLIYNENRKVGVYNEKNYPDNYVDVSTSNKYCKSR
ncbi:MAG: hypothetical protein IJA94_05640 [Bacilli bacterium]|nr:hypothetical protein [Bacilli bacterium]